MRRLPLPAMAALGLVVGCGPMSAVLTSSAERVQLAGQTEVEGCTFLGPVSARVGGNLRSFETNVEIAMTLLLNKAGAKDATHLVAKPPKTDREQVTFAGGPCENCVEAIGMAYRCSRAAGRTFRVPIKGAEDAPQKKEFGAGCVYHSDCLSNLCAKEDNSGHFTCDEDLSRKEVPVKVAQPTPIEKAEINGGCRVDSDCLSGFCSYGSAGHYAPVEPTSGHCLPGTERFIPPPPIVQQERADVQALPSSAFSQRVYVQGYTKKNGAYVAPHTRSAPRSPK